ncbi:MAG TPA: ABC transporter transmembrane domain-containing protein [Syntrophobacteraceae bacterium]|nr:ABC transporter transmembrane domain-containing protein [Syntrophobacteraceae bacterium]
MGVYERQLRLVAPYRRRIALGMLCMALAAGCGTACLYLIKPAFDELIVNKNKEMLNLLCMALLFVFGVKGVALCGNAYLMSYVSQRIITRLREDVYNHIQCLPVPYLDKVETGNLMSRILSDVGAVQSTLSDSVTGIIKESFSVVGCVGIMFYMDWQLAIAAMFIVPVAFLPVFKVGKLLRRTAAKAQQSIADLSVILHETISGNRIVKAFGMEQYEKGRFRRENENLLKHTLRAVVARSVNSAGMEFLGGLGIVSIMLYGGHQIIGEKMTAGNLFSFLAALISLYEPVKRLANIYTSVHQGLAAADRIYELLDEPTEIIDQPGARRLDPVRKHLEFRKVSFSYGEKEVLSDISFKVKVGQVVALVGMSGAGKTTLINLIPRFYDVTEGSVLIDGIDIREVTLSSLRSQIAVVTQQSILFNDSFRNNIAYGDIRKSDEEIIAAARAANAYDFIMKLPDKFETTVGEQGIRLSGGERQRICIARALLKDAPILILDEATSSLDSDSELEVQKALENLMRGRTTLVIAHRLSTIQNADSIITLADGKIVEQGCHSELMTFDSEYRRLYQLQFAQLSKEDRGIALKQ